MWRSQLKALELTTYRASKLSYPLIAEFQNSHSGEVCVLLGNGPTLAEYVPLENAIHIACNHFGSRAFCKDKNLVPDYYFLSDKHGIDTNESILNYRPMKQRFFGRFPHKIDHGPIPAHEKELNASGIPYIVYENRDFIHSTKTEERTHEWREWEKDLGQHMFGGTITTALKMFQFALYCGFDKIILVGCDCTTPYENMVDNWKEAKKFAQNHYSSTKISVMRPMGLSGIFDEFTTKSKICVITANFGKYEQTCKPFPEQTIPVDFICFTENESMDGNGWHIDTHPYHVTNRSTLDDGKKHNSIDKNIHTFNIAKYYKQQFYLIPRLQKYDFIIWMDGTLELTDPDAVRKIHSILLDNSFVTWKHEIHNKFTEEVNASNFERYTSTFWHGQPQPYQDVFRQYEKYLQDGFQDGQVYLTCMVGYNMNRNNNEVQYILDVWYDQTLNYTTQDQLGLPYVCWKLNKYPYILPDTTIKGDRPHTETDIYNKRAHGK